MKPELFRSLLQAVTEMVAHMNGEPVPGVVVTEIENRCGPSDPSMAPLSISTHAGQS